MFDNLDVPKDVTTVEEDRLGGSYLFETDIYDATITMAYGIQSANSKSCALSIIFKIGDKEFKKIGMTNSIWFKNRDGGITDKNGKILMGYNSINSLCVVTTDKEFKEQVFEEKTVKIWDKDAGKELPKSVMAVTSLIGKSVKVAIGKIAKNKTEKDDRTGSYVPTTEIFEVNDCIKFFNADNSKTISEIKDKKEATFCTTWLDKYKDTVIDKTSKNTKAPSSSKGASTPTKAAALDPTKADGFFDD